MTLASLLALLTLFVAVPLNLYVTWRLWRLWRSSGNPVIRERGIMSTALTIVVTVFALIFLNNDIPEPFLSGDVTKWLTRAVLLAAGILPPLYWLRLYR